MGKDLAPRIAAKLNAGLATDCTALSVENGDVIATRPVYAGKAMIDVSNLGRVEIFLLSPNVFTARSVAPPTSVEKGPVDLTDADFGAIVTGTKIYRRRKMWPKLRSSSPADGD